MSDTNAGHDQKPPERRQEKRASVSIPATFTLEKKLYPCRVLNMSAGGLLLKFDQQPSGLLLSKDDTGKTGTIIFGTEESPKSLQGKITRILVNDNVLVAAISVEG
ncbi:MAG: PilZ domain-containing protein [Spirochaetia bacterium]